MGRNPGEEQLPRPPALSQSSFEKALAIVLKHEGGYSNIPQDHGGPTKYGITQHDLSVHRGHAVTAQDVADMQVKEAGEIYEKRYWKPYHLDQVWSYKLATLIFDQGVLQGPMTAIKHMQRAVGIPADGVMGKETIAAINLASTSKAGHLFLDKCDERFHEIVDRNQSQRIFLKGWLNRTEDLRKFLEA